MKSIETQLHEALATIETMQAENASLKKIVRFLRIERARVEREAKLMGLPDVVVKRLHEAFANSTDNAGLKEAINVEKRRIR